jgi:RHS repeat-associated protein
MTTGTVSADEDECLPMVRLEYSGAWDEIDHWARSTSSSTGPWTAFSYTQDSQIPVSTRTWYRAMALGRAGTCTGGIIPSNVVVVDIDNFCSTYEIVHNQPPENFDGNELKLPSNGGNVRFGTTGIPAGHEVVFEVYVAGELAQDRIVGDYRSEFSYNFDSDSEVRIFVECCSNPIYGLISVNVGGTGGGDGSDYCHPPTGDEESVRGGMIMIEDNFCPGQTSKFRLNFGDEMERFSWSLTGGEFAAGSNQYSENPAVNWHANSGTIRIDGYFCDGGTTKLFWQEESYEMTTGTVSADEDECLAMVRLEYSGAWDEIDRWERSTSSSTGPWTVFSYTQDSQIPVSTRTWYRAMALGRAGTCTGGIIPSNVVVVDIDNFCSTYEIVHNQPPENFDGNELKLPSNGGNVRFGTTGIPAGHEVVFEVYEGGEQAQDPVVGDYQSAFEYTFSVDASVRISVPCCSDPIYGLVSVDVGGDNSGGGPGGDDPDDSGYCQPPEPNATEYNAGMIVTVDNVCPGGQTSFSFNLGHNIERYSWHVENGRIINGDGLVENPVVQWDSDAAEGTIEISGYFCYRGEGRAFRSSAWHTLNPDLEPSSTRTCKNGIVKIKYPHFYSSISFEQSLTGLDNSWTTFDYTPGDNIDIESSIWYKASVSTFDGCDFETAPIQIEAYDEDNEKLPAPVLITQQLRCGLGVLNLHLKNNFDTYQWVFNGVKNRGNTHQFTIHFVGGLNKTYPMEVTGIAEDGCISEVLRFQTKATDNCVNYVFTTASQEEGVGTIDDLNDLTYDDKSMGWTYFDGFGRSLQTVSQQSTPLGNDVIQHIEYDEFGREKASYLPYINNDGMNNGYYRYGAKNATEAFYTTPAFPEISSTNSPFAEKEYEPSPLNRLVATGASGDTWQLQGGHEVKTEYQFNVADEVINWKINSNGQVYLGTAFYLPNQLYKNIVTNENGSRVITYTDQLGREILKKTQIENLVSDTNHFRWACTYNVYDDLGNLRVVLQPQLIEEVRELIADGVVIPTTQLDELAFQYKYDGKKRMTHKKIPGKAWDLMTYDARNRLVLSQDGNMREGNKWLFTKYDALNRSVLTGIYTHSGPEISQEDMQGFVNGTVGQDGNLWHESIKEEIGNLHGYDNASFPTTDIEVISVTYYDDYHFVGKDYFAAGDSEFQFKSDVPTDMAYPANPHLLIKGQTTGSKVLVLDPQGNGKFLHSVNYFDDKLRSIQTITQNHLDGVERVTYCFDDNTENVKESYLMADKPESMTIRRWFTYDHGGRLLSIGHQIDEDEKVNIVQNSYSELGELTQKVLHSSGNFTPTQTIDYKYNIRGWLTHINDANLSESTDLFGMELYYHEGFQVPVYNGNISGVKWKTALDQDRLAYGYTFDHMDRIKGAHFVAGVNNNWIDDGMYNLEIVGGPTGNGDYYSGYDNNGNIKSLRRFGKVNQHQTAIEVLNYDYTGNKLLNVTDQGTDEGFKDGNTTGDDYEYDANGNMRVDLNKGITNISYNFLNLPETIEIAGKGTVEYVYDAAGIKLAQRIYADGATEPATVTDYIGERIYETTTGADIDLQMIHHEEGRIIPGPEPGAIPGTMEVPTWEYQYYLKDHLANTRITYGIPTFDQYMATMEIDAMENRIIENREFENIVQSEHKAMEGLNHTPASATIPNPEYVVKLDGVTRVTGPAKSLKVLPGDIVDIEVYVKYLDQTVYDERVPMSMLLGGFFGAFLSAGSEMLISNGFVSEGLLSSLPVIQDPDKSYEGVPNAFVNVLLFDKEYTLELGAKYAISTDGKFELGDTDLGPHEYLDIDPITIQEEGYIYIYLSGETEQSEVYFDDLLITHTHSPIVQKDDYYPFGLTFNSSERSGFTSNKFLFQSQELQDDLDLNWYSFKWRNHQPDIGRFFNIDPLAEDYYYNSPYAFSENKVTSHVELEGLEAVSIQAEGRGIVPVAGNLSITASGAYGLAVGTRRGQEGIHAVTFISGSLGPASGIGLSGGIGTYVHSGDLEDLSGLGFGTGGFLGANPVGVPGGSLELNTNGDATQIGGLIPFASPGGALGGGVWAEASYTEFMGDPLNLTDMSKEAIGKLAESLGISGERLTELINNATEYITTQQNTQTQSLEEMQKELEQGYLVPSDATSVQSNRR